MLKISQLVLFVCLSLFAGSFLAFVDTFMLASDTYDQQQAAKYASFQSDMNGLRPLENHVSTGVCGTGEFEKSRPEIGRICATKLDYWAVRATVYSALIFFALRMVSALFLRFCRELRMRFFSLVMAFSGR